MSAQRSLALALYPSRSFCFPFNSIQFNSAMDISLLSFRSSQTLTVKPNPNPLFNFPSSKRSISGAAISRTKKEETVQIVKTHLEDCHLLAAIKCQGFTVKQFQELRRSLPEPSKLLVAKNTLVSEAVEGTTWEALKPCMKGMNAWLFVHSEEIRAAIKPYTDFLKEKKLEGNDFTGAVFEGKFYASGEFKVLETLPTRAEIDAYLLGALQGPAIGLLWTLQAPVRDVVMV